MQRFAFPIILTCGALALAISFGIRQSFGLLLTPIHADLGWSISAMAFSIAIQNLLWGAVQPIAGALSDTRGPAIVLAGGGVLYALGLYVMSLGISPFVFGIGAGGLIGVALSAAGMSVAMGAVARTAPERWRGLAMGLVTAGASLGQFAFVPFARWLLQHLTWQQTLLTFCAAALCISALAPGFIYAKPAAKPADGASHPSLRTALREATGDVSFLWLNMGFFVCGFHVAFISVHLPVFAALCNLPVSAAATSLALVGLFNAGGSVFAGYCTQIVPPKYLLSAIYGLRAVVILIFIALPVTETSIVVFGAAMGVLWLSTVAPTSGIVARLYGARYLSTLFGIVFFSHQIGAFLGVWLGGVLYDKTGSYTVVWWIAIALGVFAAIVHLPIRNNATATAARPATQRA